MVRPEARAKAWLRQAGICKPELYVDSLAEAIRAAQVEAFSRSGDEVDSFFADESPSDLHRLPGAVRSLPNRAWMED